MNVNVKITRQENADYFGRRIGDTVAVPFEEYVAAVTASEIGNGPMEACKAQAVAARTFAVSRGVLGGKAISDASSTAQAYRARRYSASYQNCIEAAEQTAGEILTYEGTAISAVYSASNGGRTVSSAERWGGTRPYLIAQDDPWDAAAGTGRQGHGVGMSQRGAAYAAKQDIEYREILEFYYPDTELKPDYGRSREVIPMAEKPETVRQTALSLVGCPYVMGGTGKKCTPDYRKARARQYSKYEGKIYKNCQQLSGGKSSCIGCKWADPDTGKGKLCFDCAQFALKCMASVGIPLVSGANSQWLKTNFSQKGEITLLPREKVALVFRHESDGKKHHVGVYMGDGTVVHAKGHDYGVVHTPIEADSWTHFGIPAGLYDTGLPTLRQGNTGEYVMLLQTKLKENGADLNPDGIFGKATKAAVQAFQKAHGLSADGVCGPMTWTALGVHPKPETAQDQVMVPELPEDADEIPELYGPEAENGDAPDILTEFVSVPANELLTLLAGLQDLMDSLMRWIEE